MTVEETGGAQLDVILITGDAYVDHSTFGVALIGRWLLAHGYSVGVIAQPDWSSADALRVLGRPRLFFGVTAGNMDSMVNHYTAARRIRSDDAYSPGGQAGLRPDRASVVYANRAREAFPGVPVILGGVEASLRRVTHFDYWQDRLRRPVLLDAKADLLVFGMGELPILEIAQRLDAGRGIAACRDIPGVAWALGKTALTELDAARKAAGAGSAGAGSAGAGSAGAGSAGAGSAVQFGDTSFEPGAFEELPSHEACIADGAAFNRLTIALYRESNPHNAKVLLQRVGDRAVWCNPPARPMNTAELDRLYELPYQNAPHPCYRAPIPAFESIRGSITVNRGCSGGCSFCSLTLHQGKDVVSRSAESVVREVQSLTSQRGFNGVISDLGGPTANMFQMRCNDEAANKLCRRVSCLHPTRCKHYGTDHQPYLDLLRTVRTMPGVKRVYVNSGIRYDLAALDKTFVEEISTHHVSGTLTTAPEHVSAKVLHHMRKPEITHFADFLKRFDTANKLAGKKQLIVPYFQCAHPGCGPAESIELALYLKRQHLKVRQVQLFIPTPGTLATAMYVTGRDPHTREPLPVAKGDRERARQRAMLFWWKEEEWPAIREALITWGRRDLIGNGPEHLVPPGPIKGAAVRGRGVPAEPTVGAMGAVVDKATRSELDEERWEGHAGCAT